MSSNSKSWTRGSLAAFTFGLCFAGVTACAPEAGETPQGKGGPRAATARTATGSGSVETAAGVYTFTPTLCGIHTENGFDDIEVGGPGQAPDGEKIYVELSSTGNHVVVNLGADGPFSSTGRKIQGGRGLSKEIVLEVSGRMITASGVALIDDQGQPVDGNARLQIDCGQ